MGRWDWDSATKNMVPHGFLRPGWSPTPSHSLWLDARFHSARCCPKATLDQTELSLTKERYSDIPWILILFCDKTEYVACICTCNYIYIYIYRLYTSYNTQKRDSFAVVEVEESESLHRVGCPSNRVEDDWSQHVTGWILDSWCLKKKTGNPCGVSYIPCLQADWIEKSNEGIVWAAPAERARSPSRAVWTSSNHQHDAKWQKARVVVRLSEKCQSDPISTKMSFQRNLPA